MSGLTELRASSPPPWAIILSTLSAIIIHTALLWGRLGVLHHCPMEVLTDHPEEVGARRRRCEQGGGAWILWQLLSSDSDQSHMSD